MKYLSVIALTVTVLTSTATKADVIIEETHDNTGGTVYGGIIGLLLGGLAGGPIGALAGAGFGALAGRNAQDASGLSQRAYVIETGNGDRVIVRSPNTEFSPGQSVAQEAGRLHLAN
jgi:outer membrane lipoprotein SlyB